MRTSVSLCCAALFLSISHISLALSFVIQAKPVLIAAIGSEQCRSVKPKEWVCLKHTDWTVACGKVKTTDASAISFEVLRVIPISKIPKKIRNSFQFAVGKEVKEHSLIELRCAEGHSRSISSLGFKGVSKRRKAVQIARKNAEQPMLFGVGMDFMFPFLKYQFPLGPHISAGFVASLLNYPLPGGVNLNGYGSQFTVNYYGDSIYQGLWAEFGIGAVFLKRDSQINHWTTPSTLAHLGYRWRWNSGPAFGFAAGAQYIFNPEGFSGVLPSISIDVSFLF